MEIVTVENGKTDASGIETGGDRTLQTQERPKPEVARVTLPATDAELETRRKNIQASMGWLGKEQQIAPAAPAPAPAAPPVVVPPPAPPLAPAPAPAPAPTTEELITRTARATAIETARRVGSTMEAPPAGGAPVLDLNQEELSREDMRDYQILLKMEEIYPETRGIADKVKEFALSRYAYQGNWQEQNPGKEYDPKASEHEDFYKGEPEIDEEQFQDAKVALMVEEGVDRRMAPIEKERKLEKTMAETRGVIAANVMARIQEFVTAVDPAMAALLLVDGKFSLAKELVAKVAEADPVFSAVMDERVKPLYDMISELEKVAVSDGAYVLMPQSNALHALISRHVRTFEENMLAQPADKQVRNGKQFMTHADFNARMATAGKNAKKQAELEQFWTAECDDIEASIVSQFADGAKAEIEKIDRLGRARFKITEPAAPKPGATLPTTAPVLEPQPTNIRPAPPSLGAGNGSVDTNVPAPGSQKTKGQVAVETHWGG